MKDMNIEVFYIIEKPSSIQNAEHKESHSTEC